MKHFRVRPRGTRGAPALPAGESRDLLLVGPYPPPAGGIAVHVQRLAEALRNEGLKVGILDHYAPHREKQDAVIASLSRNPLAYWRELGRRRALLVHYHHSRLSTLVAVALRARLSRTPFVVTVHGQGLAARAASGVPGLGRFIRWALSSFAGRIFVSPEAAAGLASLDGVRNRLIPAFLPPAATDLEECLPPRLERFAAGEGATLVVAAFRISLVEAEADLYGLDLAVEAFCLLAPVRPELRLAILVSLKPTGGAAAAFVRLLEARVAAAGLEARVMWSFGGPLLPLFRHRVVYLRPTRSEGDAVSVREALAAGVPVVASDVTLRPPGTVLFPSGNAAALAAAAAPLVESCAGRPDGGISQASAVRPVLEFYRHLAPALGRPCGA